MFFFKKKSADTQSAAELPQAAEVKSGAFGESKANDLSLETITTACRQAAQGDLEARIIGLSDDPVYGTMVTAINSMLDMADSFVRETGAAMSCFSQEEFHRPILLRGMKGAYRSSSVIINKAGMRMKNSSEALSLVADLATENTMAVNTVASACEELNATGSQISSQTAEALHLSETSLHHGQDAMKKMEILESAFRQIDNIVALIINISEKTNLLALNATIEATRAGEHGARFAIISKEVKELSKNTASATEGIRKQVDLLRVSVEGVSALIHTIYDSLNVTTANSSSIANSIREQVAATDEISQRIAELTVNSQKVADHISRH